MAEAKNQSAEVVKDNPVNDFVVEYNKLVEKFQYQLQATPAFRMRDDGTWSIVLQNSVAKLPDKE